MIIEGIVGSLLGGAFRLAPEILKFLDRKGDRAHELEMTDKQIEAQKLTGQFKLEERTADVSVAQLEAMQAAYTSQAQMATAGGWFVAAVSALVRPLVTWWLVVLYSIYKMAGLILGVESGIPVLEVMHASWGDADFGMLNMVLTFWFVGRVYERKM